MGEFLAYELRHRFGQGSLLIPVYREEEADLILTGEVTKIYLEPISYEVFLQTKERKILFEGRFQLIERITKDIIYENKRFSRFETYRVSEALTGLLDPGKKEALRRLSQDISELIFQEILFR